MTVSRETCFCFFTHATSFCQAAGWRGKNSALGSSVTPCKWDYLPLQIWEWCFFPEFGSVDLIGRVHVEAPVHVRLGLGNVDGCGCS